MLDSYEVVFYTVGFLIPGFVWSMVLSILVPTRTATTQVRLLEFLTLSCVNHGLWSWLLVPLLLSGFIDMHPFLSGWLLFAIIFASPVALGIASGKLLQGEWVLRFLGSLGLRTIHWTPRAWDWHFSRLQPCWVLATLKNGDRVYGLYHTQSFASSDPERQDLYLERQFRLLPTGDWAPVEDSAGVLIMPDQIATIELRKVEE